MKPNQDGKKISGPTEAISMAFASVTQSKIASKKVLPDTSALVINQNAAAANLPDTTQVISQLDSSKKAFEMSVRFFVYQVAFSSISNLVATVMFHPLDTIKVSFFILSDAQARTVTVFSSSTVFALIV